MRIDDAAVLERAREPRRKGFDGVDAWDAAACGDNPFCGDSIEVRVSFALAEGRTVIERAAFDGYACTLCTACADALMERVEGMDAREAEALAFEEALALWAGGLEVGRTRRGCAELPLVVLKRTLALLQ